MKLSRSESGRLGAAKANIKIQQQKQQRIVAYLLNPKMCLECKSVIGYDIRKNVFCNSSCRAKYTNKNRKKIPTDNKCLACEKPVSKSKFCDNTCQQVWYRKNVTIPKIKSGQIDTRNVLKRWIIENYGYMCSCCKMDTWMDQPMPLELDHIDGNAGNNFPNNLRLLCPNCHALTPTWKNRNKGNGRAARGLKLN